METQKAVEEFLALKRIAVAGVSRSGESPANAIAQRFRETGHEVFAVNPEASEIDGHPTFPKVDAIEGGVEGVVVVTAKEKASAVAEQAARAGATWIWFHQGFGPVSFDENAIQTARQAGLHVISVGCPMMYCEPDKVHACAKSVFKFLGRIPKEIDAG
jgi:predicted CoA-binding protein